jgi:hypothetical protein
MFSDLPSPAEASPVQPRIKCGQAFSAWIEFPVGCAVSGILLIQPAITMTMIVPHVVSRMFATG